MFQCGWLQSLPKKNVVVAQNIILLFFFVIQFLGSCSFYDKFFRWQFDDIFYNFVLFGGIAAFVFGNDFVDTTLLKNILNVFPFNMVPLGNTSLIEPFIYSDPTHHLSDTLPKNFYVTIVYPRSRHHIYLADGFLQYRLVIFNSSYLKCQMIVASELGCNPEIDFCADVGRCNGRYFGRDFFQSNLSFDKSSVDALTATGASNGKFPDLGYLRPI
mmetsp:Transcript_4368/g.10451  ORF Transcript_4368/g.10451 Transcript_4368/m.10451 type:complete len:215 (-) Transcript_4368:2116-2760(-)